MDYSNSLNVGYILSLVLDNDQLTVKKIPIKYSDYIISVLNKLDEYDSYARLYSVFDVEKYIKQCTFDQKNTYSYCWPNEYDAAYISKASIQEIDKKEYDQKLKDIEDQISSEYDKKIHYRHWVNNHFEYLSNYEKVQLEHKKKLEIEEAQSKYEQLRLHQYIEEVKRYIFAQHYNTSIQDIKKSCLIYSSEAIGWYKPHYNITGNARIGLSSNFCYGRSAYFDVLLNYKGINILPYSDLVNYYWSNMMDNIRCTRSYRPYRYNWDTVLDFVAEICNWIERDSASFEKKWIIDEVEAMMNGLKDIKENIDNYYKKLEEAKEADDKDNSLPRQIKYRNINDSITRQYQTYPHETTLVLQVDKLSAALSLLEELTSLKNIYAPIVTHINTIIKYNEDVIPAIEAECVFLTTQIESKQKKLKQLENDIKNLQQKISIRQNEISAALDASDEEYKNMSPNEQQKKLIDAYADDKEYKMLDYELSILHEKLRQTENEIRDRQNFKAHFEDKRDYIVEYLNNWSGQFNLLQKGLFIHKNSALDIKQYEVLAEQGNAAAQYALGKIYCENKDDKNEAFKWFNKSASQNHDEAFTCLGCCYENGYGTNKNYNKALELYLKSAMMNNARAQASLGRLYFFGIGVSVDYKKALEWYTKAAEHGLEIAQYALGYCYYYGKGVDADSKKAAEWYEKAAEQGNASAQGMLGQCYRLGNGVPQNYKISAEWYHKAAEQGDAIAQYIIGVYYYNGFGVPKDTKKAIEWIKKAANQGHEKAIKALTKKQ